MLYNPEDNLVMKSLGIGRMAYLVAPSLERSLDRAPLDRTGGPILHRRFYPSTWAGMAWGTASYGRAPGASASGASSTPTFGSQSSHLGRYQFQSPRSFMLAGSSTDRMIVASMSTATPRPRPNSWPSTFRPRAKVPKTPTMMAAALVICPAVSLIPSDTDASFPSPRS